MKNISLDTVLLGVLLVMLIGGMVLTIRCSERKSRHGYGSLPSTVDGAEMRVSGESPLQGVVRAQGTRQVNGSEHPAPFRRDGIACSLL